MKLRFLFLGAGFLCASCGHHDGVTERSGSAANRNTSVKHDPCSLITKEEMAQVIGVGILEAKADGPSCKYLPENPMEGSAEVQTNWNAEEARAMIAAMKAGDQATGSTITGGTQNIAGLGDEATFSMSALNVRKGDAFFSIMVTLPNRFMASMRQDGGQQKFNAALLEMDKTLAQKALARL